MDHYCNIYFIRWYYGNRAGTIKTMFFAGGLMAVTNLLFAIWLDRKSEVLFAML